MSELVDFLTARLDEDESWARSGSSHNDVGDFARDNYGCLLVQTERVLAEVEAKRAIVAEHALAEWVVQDYPVCETCVSPDDWTVTAIPAHLIYPCRTLRLLALPYADNPSYREEWRP